MQKIIKNTISILLVVVMAFGAAPLARLAGLDPPELNLLGMKAEATTSGTCGENLTWTFYTTTGELIINGTGIMYDWSSTSDVPWDLYRSSIKLVTIENGVISIGNHAFENCTALTSVAISDSVIYINNCAFRGCTGLVGIEIPNSVTSLGTYAFLNCSSLKAVRIPKTVEEVSMRCFIGCDSLEVFEIEDGSTAVVHAANLFQGCPNLSKISLPDSVCFVGINSSQTQNFSLSILNSVYYKNVDNWDGNFLYIGNHLVASKSIDTSFGIEIKKGTVSIFPGVLSNYPNLTHIFLPETIKMIGYQNFTNQTSLSYVCVASTEEAWNNVVVGYNNAYLDYSHKIYNHSHNESTVKITKGYTPVTCETDGFSGDVFCYECEWQFQNGEIIAAPGHDYKEFIVAATCTQDGSKSIYCSTCGETQNTTVIPSNGHDFGDWAIVKAPTCTDLGFAYRTCKTCGFIENKIINENGHEWEIEYTVDKVATCTADGAKSIHCTDCDATKDNEVIAKNGHDYGEWIVLIAAECERIGVKYRECEVCDFAQVEEIEQLNHDWEAEHTIDVPATCTAEGSKSYHCTRCEEKNDVTVIPANGHSAGEWETKTPATYLSDGEEINKCTVCEIVLEERSIAKLVSPAVNIKTPSTTTINYGDKIVLHAETSKLLPSGWKIKWTADNSNFTYNVSADASTCTISPEKSGDTTFIATVYDENGNVMGTDTQKITSKAGFFDKIAAFFKKLFGATKVIPQAFKEMF